MILKWSQGWEPQSDTILGEEADMIENIPTDESQLAPVLCYTANVGFLF